MVAPSVNVTAPDGIPFVEVTVAVNVTDCPGVDGLGAEVTAVEVALEVACVPGGISGKLAVVASTTKSSKLTV